MYGGDAEQDAGGTGGLAAALFPVTQRGGADAKGGRELRLAEVEFGPDGGRLIDCEPALYRVLNLGEGRGGDHAEAAHQMSGRDSRNALGVEAARIEPACGVRHLEACASQSRRAGNEGDDGALDLVVRQSRAGRVLATIPRSTNQISPRWKRLTRSSPLPRRRQGRWLRPRLEATGAAHTRRQRLATPVG